MQKIDPIQGTAISLVLALALTRLSTTQAQIPNSTYHVQVINQMGMTTPGDIIQLLKDDKGYLWILSPSKVQRY